jgi:tetratricopeptide (TPR) repeat protein
MKTFESSKAEPAIELLAIATHLDRDNDKIQQKIADSKSTILNYLVQALRAKTEAKIDREIRKLQVARKLKAANKLLSDGKVDEVEIMLKELTEDEISSEEFMFLKAEVDYIKGSMKLAILQCEEVLKLNPENPKAKQLIGKSKEIDELVDAAAQKATEKKYEDSIEILTKILTVDNKNNRINQAAYFQRSLAHFSLFNTSAAFADFKKFEALQQVQL